MTVEELNKQGIRCELLENAVPRAYFKDQPNMGRADLVLKLTDCKYDIGLYKQADGSYEPRTDFFAGYVEKILGAKASDKTPDKINQAKLGKLFQMYGICAATEKARKSGYTVRRVANEDGSMKLIVGGFQ